MKLLKYINSAFFNERISKIESIKEAIIALGQDEIRHFISLVIMTDVGVNKPRELIVSTFVRAKFAELLAREISLNPSKLFLIGLLSNLDALLDQEMEEILKNLPLAEDIANTLITEKGDSGNCLKFVKAYERGRWKDADIYQQKLKLDKKIHNLALLYIKSCEFASNIIQ